MVMISPEGGPGRQLRPAEPEAASPYPS